LTPFRYHRATDLADALALARTTERAAYVAGGTTLIDLMKEGVEQPAALIDLTRVPGIGAITREGADLRIGALVRNSDLARHDEVIQGWPLLSQAVLAGASAQLRNMATVGGNLLQRTRCPYFRTVAFACNKREPGAGCAAQMGPHRGHAILGVSDACIATHPSDMAVAMVAITGEVRVLSDSGFREIPIGEFHRLPGMTPELESDLRLGEIIASVRLAATPPGARASYVKVRDRASYEFALTSAAVMLSIDTDRITHARIALGGVATVPWRASEAEAVLVGERPIREAFHTAAEVALAGARPRTDNAFKVELGKRTLVRALEQAAARTLEGMQ
jgi:xanthine dehydrogenase YagS FAD-binding subunit